MTAKHNKSPELDVQWARVRAKLRTEFGDAAFKSWLKPLTLHGIHDGSVQLAVSTRFLRDWIVTSWRSLSRWVAHNGLLQLADRYPLEAERLARAGPPRRRQSPGKASRTNRATVSVHRRVGGRR